MILLVCALNAAVFVGCYFLQKRPAGDERLRIRMGFDVVLAAICGVLALFVYPFFLEGYRQNEAAAQTALYAALIFPAAFYVLFLLLMAVFQSWRNRLFEEDRAEKTFSLFAYKFRTNPETGVREWGLKPGAQKLEPLFRKASSLLLTGSLLYQLICLFFQTDYPAFWYGLPAAGVPLLRTLSLYLDGPVLEQQEARIRSASAGSSSISFYEKAMEHLRRRFPRAVLASDSQQISVRRGSPEILLNKLASSMELDDQTVAAYFRSEFRHQQIDPDYVHAVKDLIAKRNVFFRNPFYKDIGMYLALPLNQSLMMNKKVLILSAGDETALKAGNWMKDLLDSHSGLQEKWKLRRLQEVTPDTDVGILSYTDLNNPRILELNQPFFAQTEYVVLLEPSDVLITSQLSLRVLSDLLRKGDVKPVFAIIDRNLSGLKDTLSHVLKTPIDCDVFSYSDAANQRTMVWDAGFTSQEPAVFDRQTRYLGGGIEIGAEAVSVQIPQATWISQNCMPVLDLQTSASHVYRSICALMKTDQSQAAMKESLPIHRSLWDLEKRKDQFLMVEDEFNHPFLLAAEFLSRAENESFVNVLSENYLLRNYFCANAELFMTDPNAVPSLVPDFAKTERNVLIKLLLQMLITPMEEHEVLDELALAGNNSSDALGTLIELLEVYTNADPALFETSIKKEPAIFERPKEELYISVNKQLFDLYFSSTLKNVNYVLEDECLSRHYLDSRLYSMVLQTILPGQYLTFEGKYYQVKLITPASGVVLKRASDRITSRKAYRQLRTYQLPAPDEKRIISHHKVNGFSFIQCAADFQVETTGYLELKSAGSLLGAYLHDLSKDPDMPEYERSFKNKSVLYVTFPDTDQKIIWQTALLFQELLPSVLPSGAPFLAVLANQPDNWLTGYNSFLYTAQGNLPDGTICFVEDSELDLGLLNEIENYFFILLKVIQDYLRWSLNDPDEDASADHDTADFGRNIFENCDLTADQTISLFRSDNGQQDDQLGATTAKISKKETDPAAQPDEQSSSSMSPSAEENASVDVPERKWNKETKSRSRCIQGGQSSELKGEGNHE